MLRVTVAVFGHHPQKILHGENCVSIKCGYITKLQKARCFSVTTYIKNIRALAVDTKYSLQIFLRYGAMKYEWQNLNSSPISSKMVSTYKVHLCLYVM